MKKIITLTAAFALIAAAAYFTATAVNAKSVSAQACQGSTYCQ